MTTPPPATPPSPDPAADLAAFYGDAAAGGPSGGARASTGARVVAVIGGLLLVALALTVTLGFALLGLLGLGVAAFVQRRRARPYSRLGGWLGAVGASTLALFAAAAVLAAFVPAGFGDKFRQEMKAAAAQPLPPPTAADSVLGRMVPGGRAASEAQRKAVVNAVSGSNAATYGFLAVVALFSCAMWGTFIGSAAWGSATVLLYGVLGRWPGARPKPVVTYDPAAPYVPPYEPDAFDRI